MTNNSLDYTAGRIHIQESLLSRAINNDEEALNTIFHQFVPVEENIQFTEYYGFFGFWFVGFHSFSCLTEKRIAILRVGPFKRITYEDGFYENMTSGGIYQPSKFWLYILLLIGVPISFVFLTMGLAAVAQFVLLDFLNIFSVDGFAITLLAGIASFFLLPFVINFLMMAFYRLNPCGLACWIRERRPVVVFVNRENMVKANRLYRLWSNLRDQRVKSLKKKAKKSPVIIS